MHVGIVGEGALGAVYGVRLARAGLEAAFVVRPGRESDTRPIAIERVDGDRRRDAIDAPVRVTDVPAYADVVLVCVRADQLSGALVDLLRKAPDVPVVILTPMMPDSFARMRAGLGDRVYAAMPSAIAHRQGNVVRYWLPALGTTLVDEGRPTAPAVVSLVAHLNAAGVRARIEKAVHETNPATTACFIPLAMALDAAGSVTALLGDPALLAIALKSAAEGRALGHRIGNPAAWASFVSRFASPMMLGFGVRLARARSPEIMTYIEEHFGRKLHEQNVAMARTLIELARDRQMPHGALDKLLERLETPSP
jgi:ketopantoate reductase